MLGRLFLRLCRDCIFAFCLSAQTHFIYTCFCFTWFGVENKDRWFSARLRCKKLRFAMTSAFFAWHHLRGTHAPGEALGTQNMGVQKRKNPSNKKNLVMCVSNPSPAVRHLAGCPEGWPAGRPTSCRPGNLANCRKASRGANNPCITVCSLAGLQPPSWSVNDYRLGQGTLRCIRPDRARQSLARPG